MIGIMADPELVKVEDDQLAYLAAQGNKTALESLLERHVPTALSFVSITLDNPEDAHDAAQIALMRIARELASGWRGRSFKACLYACARHAASDLLSEKRSRQRREK